MPPEVAQSTVTVPANTSLAGDSSTVKVRFSPSSAETSSATRSSDATMRPNGHTCVSVRRHTVAVLPSGNSRSAGTDQYQFTPTLMGEIRSENANACPPNSSVRGSSFESPPATANLTTLGPTSMATTV